MLQELNYNLRVEKQNPKLTIDKFKEKRFKFKD